MVSARRLCSCQGHIFTLLGIIIVLRLKVGSFHCTDWHLGPGGSAPLVHSNEERDDGGRVCLGGL